MTRKDYIAIAVALKSEQPRVTWSLDKHAQYTHDVRAVAEALFADNPRFDFRRFYRAAGLEQRGLGEPSLSRHEHSSVCDCQQKAT